MVFGRITFTHRLEAGQSRRTVFEGSKAAQATSRSLCGSAPRGRARAPPAPTSKKPALFPGVCWAPTPRHRAGMAGSGPRGPGAARGVAGVAGGWQEVPEPGVSCSTPGTRGRAGSALGPGRGERQELRGCTERKRALQSRRLPSPGIFVNSSGSSIIAVVLLLLSMLY